ncbi:MAG: DNA replication/repair protein RecF [Wenzhouxiangella sp.]|nr:DNA replication/repair protein RecF [Wenzhouxiangella sp.]
MSLAQLTIEGVRNLAPVTLRPSSNLNWFQGENGAGKTSVLEAVYLLARGRSFRSHRIGSVIQHNQNQLRVVAQRAEDGTMLGMERSSTAWRGRIAGQDCHRLSEFAARLPLVLIEPDSHRLIDGGPEHRRQHLDWQLFHVEPDYLPIWQRYSRYLRQRNAALKSNAETAVLRALEGPMAEAGEKMGRLRAGLVESTTAAVLDLAEALGVQLPGEVSLAYRGGYDADAGLALELEASRARDRELGYTRRGPHRAELIVQCDGQSAAQELSRGQQKLLAMLLLLAKFGALRSGPTQPLLLLDDPVSELDRRHFAGVLAWLEGQDTQVWVTSTSPCPCPATVFHVEQGRIRPVV